MPESLADYVLDGGPARVGIESTVLSLVDAPVLLRPGVIPLPEIEALIGPVEMAAAPGPGAHASPGMHPRHYRPATPLYLLDPGERPPEGHGAWLRIGQEMPANPLEYAAVLYETLHRLDAAAPGLDCGGASAGNAGVGGGAGPAAAGGGVITLSRAGGAPPGLPEPW